MKTIKSTIIILSVAFYIVSSGVFLKGMSSMAKPSGTGEYRITVESTDEYDIRYRLQEKMKFTGWWEDVLVFTQGNIADRYGDITYELIDQYIEEDLGYLPEYEWVPDPKDPSDKIRRALKQFLEQIVSAL